jgi:pantoate--beta-alanine ligase
MSSLPIVRNVPALRDVVRQWRSQGHSVGLVPTMGALHEGHASLIRLTRGLCDQAIVSIFVNPRQFGPREDFRQYPREEEADIIKARDAGATLVFAPSVEEMYPEGHATSIHVQGLSESLCGAFRPGHFDGVATIVAKLLLQSLPDIAAFGEKDYQQLLLVRRMVHDLDIPVRIVAGETVREPDGLALSSRNRYLSPAERAIAPALAETLTELARNLARDPSAVAAQEKWGVEALRAAGFTRIDYLEVRDAETLVPVEVIRRPARVLAAAWLGSTRLIDNMPIPA